MTSTAEFFATILYGKLAGATQAYPPHELEKNQIALTEEEFNFLRNIKSFEYTKKMVKSIDQKVKKAK